MTAPDTWRTTLDLDNDVDSSGERYSYGDKRRRVLNLTHSDPDDWTYTTRNAGFSTANTEY
jgi:hypothetical protein